MRLFHRTFHHHLCVSACNTAFGVGKDRRHRILSYVPFPTESSVEHTTTHVSAPHAINEETLEKILEFGETELQPDPSSDRHLNLPKHCSTTQELLDWFHLLNPGIDLKTRTHVESEHSDLASSTFLSLQTSRTHATRLCLLWDLFEDLWNNSSSHDEDRPNLTPNIQEHGGSTSTHAIESEQPVEQRQSTQWSSKKKKKRTRPTPDGDSETGSSTTPESNRAPIATQSTATTPIEEESPGTSLSIPIQEAISDPISNSTSPATSGAASGSCSESVARSVGGSLSETDGDLDLPRPRPTM